MRYLEKTKTLFLGIAAFFVLGAGMLRAEPATCKTEIVRVGATPFSLMRFGGKRWVVGVGFGAYGNSVSVLYFQGENTPGTALENSLPSASPDRKAVLLAGAAQQLVEIWRKVGEDVNPYAFENLRVSEKKVFDKLLFSGMPFSVTEDGHFKISGVFPNLRSWRNQHADGRPENAFDFVYDDAAGTWFDVTAGAREPMPSGTEISAEDWIGYAIERKNRTRETALPLPDGYDPARVRKLFERHTVSPSGRENSAARYAELSGDEGFVRGNGKTVFWKRYKPQDWTYLFLESEGKAAMPFPRCFNENFRQKLEAEGISVPAKVKQIALPFRSKKALRLERRKPFISENGNFAFSAKIFGYDFSFEYDAAASAEYQARREKREKIQKMKEKMRAERRKD